MSQQYMIVFFAFIPTTSTKKLCKLSLPPSPSPHGVTDQSFLDIQYKIILYNSSSQNSAKHNRMVGNQNELFLHVPAGTNGHGSNCFFIEVKMSCSVQNEISLGDHADAPLPSFQTYIKRNQVGCHIQFTRIYREYQGVCTNRSARRILVNERAIHICDTPSIKEHLFLVFDRQLNMTQTM